MKRFITILLTLATALTLGLPALADTDREAALTAVTETVVATLDVADDYTDFYGSYNDGLQPGWYLSWSKDDGSLSVECTEDGRITEVYRWSYTDAGDRFYGYDAAFPAQTEAAARREAESWLRRLMGENERARIDETNVPLTAGGEYSFSGRILINNLESPIAFSIRIGADGLSQYTRSDAYSGYVGEIPPARNNVRRGQAAPLLAEAAALELYYVTDGDEARLRYVPVGPYTVVDALTGEAVDMDALYASFGVSYNEPEAPAAEASMATADAGNGRSLTAVELSSIENYADALTEEALDGSIRSVGDLGLADFALTRCSYAMDADGEITASLRYTCEMTADNLFGYSMDEFWQSLDWGETPTVQKYVTVNAKTGALISVSTSYSLWEQENVRPADEDVASRFLAAVAPEMAAESALCALQGYGESFDSFTFARTHDGWFFPENYLYVRMNAVTGTVDEYRYEWDEDVVFAPSDGIIDEAAAKKAYTDALTVALGYVAWPEAVDYSDPILYRYADWGYTFVESLRLAYYYGGTDAVSGVDALTGEPIRQSTDGGYVYSDLDGVPERAVIEALGAAGVGFAGGAFHPDAPLTMGDAVRLLLASAGYRADEWDVEDLKSEAVWQGFVTAADWEPEREITQEAFIRMIVSASRYGDAARLEGVGFETVAQALGLIDGPMPTEACTRADAASLLYAFMTR